MKNSRVKTKYLPLESEIWHSALVMFLRSIHRNKDGKDHRYFSIVENHRLASDRTVQRTVLYLGEINDQQQAAWRKTLSVFDEEQINARTLYGLAWVQLPSSLLVPGFGLVRNKRRSLNRNSTRLCPAWLTCQPRTMIRQIQPQPILICRSILAPTI